MKFLSSKLPRFKFLRSWRGVVVIVAVLLILFLYRPGVYQLRNRISTSIGRALGRRVAIDNVRFHLLPRPGFDLEGLVIYDDPEFSAEPMIRSEEVFAAIRVRSLLRGRLEIATLSATEPSINLVRNQQGRWNLASLLERNAQIPAAPTEKPAFERRPAFPYLEASSARVNFKLGLTKKSYALMDADVALWQDSENSWSARIKAEPVRTDFHLTDTGLLQISARWQRAPNLRLTPLEISVQWQKGQLGQITQLLSGKDRGWRGGVNFVARLSGTPETLRIESQTAVEDFRRYDIVDNENLRLATACSGEYDAITGTLARLRCESPVGGGALRLRGTATLSAQVPAYDLTLEAANVPLNSVVRWLRHAKKQIPGELTASGLLNAEFRVQSQPREGLRPRMDAVAQSAFPQWTGTGSATNARLVAGADKVALGTIPLSLISGINPAHRTLPGRRATKSPAQTGDQQPAEAHLQIGPVAMAIDNSTPVSAGGWISIAGYFFSLRGETELTDLFRLERVLGLPAARPAAEGSAKLDVSISGPWRGFVPPTTLGTAQLRNVRAETRGLNTPIEIGSATVTLTPNSVLLQKISARTGNTHWTGGVTAPRQCGIPNSSPSPAPDMGSNISGSIGLLQSCPFHFDLTADELSTADLGEWFEPHPQERPWYRLLSPDEPTGRSPLLAIEAQGNLHVGRFLFKRVVVTQVASQVEVERGRITLSALRGQLLQGRHLGRWTIDASRQSPLYRGSGSLQNISLEEVGALMSDPWIAGTADGNFDLDGSGNSFREVLASSDGRMQFAMRNGSLPHIIIPGSPAPLAVHRFNGELRLKKGAWEISGGKMESRDGFYQVTGTASPAGVFDFVLTSGNEQSFALTGTPAKPYVTPLAPTQAPQTEVNATAVKP